MGKGQSTSLRLRDTVCLTSSVDSHCHSTLSVCFVFHAADQVINNPVKAEQYLDMAEDMEDANALKMAAGDAAGRLVLLGTGQPADGTRDTVRNHRTHKEALGSVEVDAGYSDRNTCCDRPALLCALMPGCASRCQVVAQHARSSGVDQWPR
jgi:hypothetical protein